MWVNKSFTFTDYITLEKHLHSHSGHLTPGHPADLEVPPASQDILPDKLLSLILSDFQTANEE